MPDGVAVLQPDGSDVGGVVRFDEMFDESGKTVIGVHITYRITGLTDGEHGLHIHRYGDLTDGCTSACEHFDPRAQELETEIAGFDSALNSDTFRESDYMIRTRNHWAQVLENRHHGSLKSRVRHFGDLGNIKSKGGISEGGLFLAKACLTAHPQFWQSTKRLHSILGRMIIVHADRDDLGKGGLKNGEIIDEAVHQESLKTGNAGKRLACGVIGLADPDTDTMTMDAESTYLATLGVGMAAAGLGFIAGRRDSRTLKAPYQPDQEISDYNARDLATSSAITGDFTTDSLKYGFGPTSLSAESDDLPDWIDHFLPGPNINPHDDSAYDEPYVKCDSGGWPPCPNPARTGPFTYSGGYIGKVTACRECWQDILEMYEEEYQEGIVQSSGTAWQDEWAAEDNYDSTYGKEQAKIRRRLKNKLMGEATMGTKAGQWSARKSQELKRRYEAACERKGIKPYKGSKTTKQKDLSNWSKQGWRTASGRKSSVTGEPYFPTKAVKALKDKELYAKAKRQKAAATRAGKQRATYSKDIQAVVARYRAEDNTIDDLDDESLMVRMENLAERLDAIVQRIGSYPDAERDPEYLRLVEQHTAYARVLARRHGFGAEEYPVLAFRYMPESAYHRALEKGYMEPWGDHGATLATIDPTPTFYQTDGWYDGGHPLSDIYQIDLTGLQYRHHQVSAAQGQVILIEGDIPVDQIQPLSFSYSNDGYRHGTLWEAESDPVSSVAAGTTDALNDFANSQDTDDKFYFIGGLVGGLAIAVLGNIISDRLQDVYFPHWWDNRGGSNS